MSLRRRAMWVSFVALILSATLVAQKKDDKKQDETQKREIQSIVKLVDDTSNGQPAANDLGLAWVHEDYLKADRNKEYVPFTVTLDPSKVPDGRFVFYWRVVKSGTTGLPAPPAASPSQKKDEKKGAVKDLKRDFAFEDVNFFDAPGSLDPRTTTRSSEQRISRSFTVPAGSYDVYVAAKEWTSTQKNAPATKFSIVKKTITIEDFWNGEFNTSSVIVAQRIDPLPTPLTAEQQAGRPYALGPIEIIPALDLKFSKKAELSPFMLIYNPKTDSANKPDVTVEYNFYAKSGGTEKYFNKTSPQNLNGQTLPPQFDLNAGHQLQTGQAVPLAAFPEGDYRLEIKVTDKIANKSVTRDVNFTIAAP